MNLSWFRRRPLKTLPDDLWRRALARSDFLRGYSEDDLRRLRELVENFLVSKQYSGAGGLVLNDEMRVTIAVEACVLILNLGLDYYDDWIEIIVYPGAFFPEREYVDEAGVVHHARESMLGESWPNGPLILSWDNVGGDEVEPGYSVVMHEFAHKLDMRNGEANGFPPLHVGMSREAWSSAFGKAYSDFCARLDAAAGMKNEENEETEIDEYAAESPAEFFAVMSEVFFCMPDVVQRTYPDVYAQLALFYRQDPLLRLSKS